MTKISALGAIAALTFTTSTAFGQFQKKEAAKAPENKSSSQKQIVINTQDSFYQPWNLQMNKGDTLAIDVTKFNSPDNVSVYGSFIGSAGPCGFAEDSFLDKYKQVKGFNLAAALVTVQPKDGSAFVASVCDAVSNAPKSKDGKIAYLIADDDQTIVNAFVNEGRQVVSDLLSSKKPIEDNKGKIKIDYEVKKAVQLKAF